MIRLEFDPDALEQFPGDVQEALMRLARQQAHQPKQPGSQRWVDPRNMIVERTDPDEIRRREASQGVGGEVRSIPDMFARLPTRRSP